MDPALWLSELSDRLGGSVEITDDERVLLLDLARIAAHTSERWAAPLSTYLAGLALAGEDADFRVRRLRDLVSELDTA